MSPAVKLTHTRTASLPLALMLGLPFLAPQAWGFSLIGPFADWMTPELNYRPEFDLGGPMNIGEGYRWNVPVLTYSFDQSFVDFFGSNGVAAVDSAVDLLNGLPPASEITPTNYPAYAYGVNWAANASSISDLKTAALTTLLRAMGLGSPSANIFAFRAYDPVLRELNCETYWPTGTVPNLILERNFDPETLSPSHWVNDSWYSACVGHDWCWHPWIYPYLIDPDAMDLSAAADLDQWANPAGLFIRSLTRDDVGGLKYLLSSNNINLEILLPGVTGYGTNEGMFVDAAMRPGVEKITFVRQDYDSILGRFFRPFTNSFVDAFYSNGVPFQQTLMRVTSVPDIVFTAEDVGGGWCKATAVTKWWNSGQLTGTTVLGPGVIVPPIRIAFHKRAGFLGWSSIGPQGGPRHWGTFGTGLGIATYPISQGPETPFRIRLRIMGGGCPNLGVSLNSHTWSFTATSGATFSLESSTNLNDWVSLQLVANQGGIFDWQDLATEGSRFYRVVPK
jgi:hypothetical protein